jgi:hypothetical protein
MRQVFRIYLHPFDLLVLTGRSSLVAMGLIEWRLLTWNGSNDGLRQAISLDWREYGWDTSGENAMNRRARGLGREDLRVLPGGKHGWCCWNGC